VQHLLLRAFFDTIDLLMALNLFHQSQEDLYLACWTENLEIITPDLKSHSVVVCGEVLVEECGTQLCYDRPVAWPTRCYCS
jgi:hypothetical protein